MPGLFDTISAGVNKAAGTTPGTASGKYAIKIPALNETASNVGPNIPYKTEAIAAVKSVKKNYSAQISKGSLISGVPETILYGFAAVESGTGGAKLVSPAGAIGLMQLTPGTVYDTLNRQLAAWTTPADLQYADYLHTLAPQILVVQNPAGKTAASKYRLLPHTSAAIYKQALFNPGFNVIAGSLAIAQLLAQSIRSTGQPRLDHVVIKYNAGIGNFARYVSGRGLENRNVDTAQLKQNFPLAETKAYILKLMGVNGTLDVQKQKLA